MPACLDVCAPRRWRACPAQHLPPSWRDSGRCCRGRREDLFEECTRERADVAAKREDCRVALRALKVPPPPLPPPCIRTPGAAVPHGR